MRTVTILESENQALKERIRELAATNQGLLGWVELHDERMQKLERVAEAAREFVNAQNMSRTVYPTEMALVKALADLDGEGR